MTFPTKQFSRVLGSVEEEMRDRVWANALTGTALSPFGSSRCASRRFPLQSHFAGERA